jgi:hypothetical protein
MLQYSIGLLLKTVLSLGSSEDELGRVLSKHTARVLVFEVG